MGAITSLAQDRADPDPRIEITRFTKIGGPLTKRIKIDDDGKLISDGSRCVMHKGVAQRVVLPSLADFAAMISGLRYNEAIALGALAAELPDRVDVVTKARLQQVPATTPDVIARVRDFIAYKPGLPALALIDIDMKGMPGEVRARIDDCGGFWASLVSVIPELASTARVVRASTSSGLSRRDTGASVPGSDGQHIYVLVKDGADIERFLRTLHDRCWLAGLGWMMVGAGGQLLDRSLVDRMVYAPERLVFEGAPILSRQLMQDQVLRRAMMHAGDLLDTITACPPLRIVEQSTLADRRAKEAHRLAPEVGVMRARFIADQATRIAARTGCAPEAARHIAEQHSGGILLPSVVLLFDDPDLVDCTVGDVLADPARFIGETLADPLEGREYGPCKALIMQRANGDLWIHSFAHGRTTYELRYDAASLRSILAGTADDSVVAAFLDLLPRTEISVPDLELIRNEVSKRGDVGKRALSQAITAARKAREAQDRAERQVRKMADRKDPRPQIPNPLPDAPWLPQMQVLNDVLGAVSAPEPPMRDGDGHMVQVRVRRVPSMHTLAAAGANDGEANNARLPAPEHPLLTRLDDVQLGELIEQYIDYIEIGEVTRSVHLSPLFVRHFRIRDDGALPLAHAVATLPLVLGDGTVLSGAGLDRKRGIVFRIPREVQALIPAVEVCTATAAAEAMRFLTDDWLADVSCDYAGKAVLIAAAATILQRLLLPERPAFFVSAGQRGGGKTTAVSMISLGVLGCRPAAAAWSTQEEERRKALLAYLGEGVPLICWDNITRGAAISCPSLERALTAETYADRVLGVSEFRTVPATAIHIFTGNNIAPRGDMASRSLSVRLNVDRPDPENRVFLHPDPLAWTEANRGRILVALYTILLANPRLRDPNPGVAETRFKAWWHLVGSAVEHAARQHAEHVAALTMDLRPNCQPTSVRFRALFQAGEVEEEQTSALATVLDVLRNRWPDGCKGSEVAVYAGAADDGAIEFKSALEQASGKAIKVVTPTTMTWRLKAITDAPVLVADRIVALHYMPDRSGNGGDFQVKEVGR